MNLKSEEILKEIIKDEDTIKVFDFEIGDNIIYLIDTFIKILDKKNKIKIIIVEMKKEKVEK